MAMASVGVRVFAGVFTLAMAAGLAPGQMSVPIPEAGKPLPEYTPPAPPPPKVETPPPAPVAPPSIITRDGAGAIAPLNDSTEMTALRALSLPPERMEVIRAFIADREVVAEKHVAANASAALQLRSKLREIDTQEVNALAEFTKLFKPLAIQPPIADALRGHGAVLPTEVEAVTTSATAYKKAANDDMTKAAGGDIGKIMVLASRNTIRQVAAEPMAALDRVLDRVVARWDAAKSAMSGFAGAGDVEAAVKNAGTPAAKRDALANALSEMTPEMQSAVLSVGVGGAK